MRLDAEDLEVDRRAGDDDPGDATVVAVERELHELAAVVELAVQGGDLLGAIGELDGHAADRGVPGVALQAKLGERAGVAHRDGLAAAVERRGCAERDPGRPVAPRAEVVGGAGAMPAVKRAGARAPVERAHANGAVARVVAGVLDASAAVVNAWWRGGRDRRGRTERERRE